METRHYHRISKSIVKLVIGGVIFREGTCVVTPLEWTPGKVKARRYTRFPDNGMTYLLRQRGVR